MSLNSNHSGMRIRRIAQSALPVLLLFLTGCAAPIQKHFKGRSFKQATQTLIKEHGDKIEQRFVSDFAKQDIHYPPHRLAILGFKQERKVEIWAKNKVGDWKYIRNYPLTASSGGPGPKLLQDDEQIPEGIYKISWLNPFSQLHLSMKLNYPNSFDRYFANLDHRKKLGGDIFIHGKDKSVGCLAIGDLAIEELYVLVAKTGLTRTEVIIAPRDLRIKSDVYPVNGVWWAEKLNRQISKALQRFA